MQNPYRGVNAHLNSVLQTPGTSEQPSLWPSFHSRHISHMTDLLNEVLPGGYVAVDEQSLQVRGAGGEDSRPQPDVTVFQQRETTSTEPQPAATPLLEMAIEPTLAAEDEMMAVVVRYVEEQATLGQAVLRIELLSPANMLNGVHGTAYQARRREAILGGLPLVEVDYLHEWLSPVLGVPRYPTDDHATAYTVTVTDPRPTLEEGRVRLFGTDVNDRLPTVLLPLQANDTLAFNFDAAYQHTYARGRWHLFYDFAHEPPRIDTYRGADASTIRAVMRQ